MKIVCERRGCNKTRDLPTGHVNRSRNQGAPIYCSRKCMGLARRTHKTKAKKVAEKKAYDAEYRKHNHAMLKAKKAAYFRATYDPKKAAAERKKNMPRHVEYCRRPEYKAWKREYDKKLRASKYGDFDEAYMLLLDINREVKQRMTDYEIRKANGTLNKKLQRERAWQRLVSGQP